MNYKYIIKIQYDGTNFNGYGTQPHGNTIQDNIEKVLTMINSNQFVKTFASSRTDAKVHAYEQFIQFEMNKLFGEDELKLKLNKLLPSEINVLNVYKDFENLLNVRYDVDSKTYIYKVITQKSPFLLNYALYFPNKLNMEKLQEAANIFVGKHDFTAFSNKNTDVVDKVRVINYIKVYTKEECNTNFIYFEVNGSGFLYNMVRLIVGTLLMVSSSEYDVKMLKKLLENKKRTKDCILAQPQGLYLKKINYNKNIF